MGVQRYFLKYADKRQAEVADPNQPNVQWKSKHEQHNVEADANFYIVAEQATKDNKLVDSAGERVRSGDFLIYGPDGVNRIGKRKFITDQYEVFDLLPDPNSSTEQTS